ncbi:MAG: glycosyltransferase, partial [Zetaproteobacteria bacterium]
QAANLPIDELIVVDGGSSDATCELLHAAKVRWIRSAPGRAQQMNAGARLATSDILLFLHADTAIDASAIEAMRQAMRSDPDVVGGRFDLRLSGSHPALRVIECMINLRSRLTRISTGDQAMFVRRAVFARLGGFPTLPLMEDVAFSRMLKRTGRIACLKARVCTSSRRWEQHGLGRTVLLMWWLRLLFWLGVPPARLARMYRHAR